MSSPQLHVTDACVVVAKKSWHGFHIKIMDFGAIFGIILSPRGVQGVWLGPGAAHGEARETWICSFFVILGASGRKKVLLVQARRKFCKIDVKNNHIFTVVKICKNRALV